MRSVTLMRLIYCAPKQPPLKDTTWTYKSYIDHILKPNTAKQQRFTELVRKRFKKHIKIKHK